MTPREEELLAVVERHQARTGASPSYLEIAAAMGLKSRSQVARLVGQLEEKGELIREPGRARSMRVVRQDLRAAAAAVLDSIRHEDLEAGTVVVSAEAIGRLDELLAEVEAARRAA